ncbi:FxSxx-COOH system tetratricopeptide repeat protein [Streptomyces sp. NPDC008240]|uniref:FxSxx-COOH system tetratricopeptide repeat protein n=1 Tax=Streptomyces sp. NPDC008240 TaxID=3364822 RepID=UPI0036EB8E68
MNAVPNPTASRAVLIGTSHYTGSLQNLPAVAANLEALAEVLCSPDVLGLPAQNCVVVADPDTPAQMIDPIVHAATEATDTLLVYYAGHGLLARQAAELHLALTGSDQQRASYTAVPYGVIGEEMARTRAERHVVVLDCCYSGRALGRMGSSDPATALADEAAIEGTYVIAAAGETKTALAIPGERYTAFTAELLTTLQHGITGEGPYLSLDTIYNEVAASLRAKQRPRPQRRTRNTAGQLILARNRAYRERAEAHKPPAPSPLHDFEPTNMRTLLKKAFDHTVALTPHRTRPGPAGAATSVLIIYAGHRRAWAAWIAQCLERHGHRAALQRWDPPREVSLEDSLGDLLLSGGRVLLVLDDWFFSLGPRPAGDWNEALSGFIAAHADRFAAVNLTNRPLLPATAVLEPASLWGLSEEAAEERLLSRLGLERQRVPRPSAGRARYPGTPCEIWGEVPRRNPRFTGRDDLLTALHQRLADAERGAAVCTLLGMSGIGKTQLAAEYAYRFSTDYDLVWWVNSEDRSILRDRLGELAVGLGLRIGSEPGERIRAVLNGLRRGEPYANWLLIFDGWEDTDGINALLPQGPGHVLITSRNRAWSKDTDILDVAAFHRVESTAYLMRRAPHITAEQADEVAAECEDIPLALVQAAGWLGGSGMEAPEYLRMVRERGLSTVDAPAADDGFPQSSMTSWSILLNRLSRVQPQAVDVLSLCTAFAPGRIPLGLIRSCPQAELPEELRWMATDSRAWTRALDTLVNYSVLTRETRGPDGAEMGPYQESVHMHRLVHDIVSKLTSEDSRVVHRQAVRTLLAQADPGNPLDSRNWPRYAELLPHLEPSGALSSAQPRVQETVLNCLRYCFRSGEYQSGLDLAPRVRDRWSRTMDPLDPPMLDLTMQESNIMRASGRFREAYDHDRGVLQRLRAADQRNELGEFNTQGAMANSLRLLGRYQEAHEIQREVLDGMRRLLGLDELATMAAQHDLGVGLRLLGRYAEACEFDLETLARQESVLRARHMDTLRSGNALSNDLRLLGRYRDALARQEPVVRLHVQVLGLRHPQTLSARGLLVMCRRREGDQRQDVGHEMASLLDQVAEVHGREHYRTLALITNYGSYLREHGDLSQARELIDEAEAGYRALLGPSHPVATGMLSNSGLVMQVAGERAEAMSTLETSFVSLTATLGADHPWVLGCALNAASACNLNGRISDAVELSRDTLRRARHTLGQEHPLTLSCQVALAADLRAGREREEAGKLEEDALLGLTRTLGAQHPHTVSARQRTRPYWDFEPYLD